MATLNELLKMLRVDNNGQPITETPESNNLRLTKQEFMDKMLKEQNDQALLDLLEFGEWRVCERLGLINGYNQNNAVYFDIPEWNSLVAHLTIVNKVCG